MASLNKKGPGGGALPVFVAMQGGTRPSCTRLSLGLSGFKPSAADVGLRAVPDRTRSYATHDAVRPVGVAMSCWAKARSSLTKGRDMWALVIFTFATTGAPSGTVTTLEFSTQQLCLEAAREVQTLTKPIISAGITRYEVEGTCVQTSEATKK